MFFGGTESLNTLRITAVHSIVKESVSQTLSSLPSLDIQLVSKSSVFAKKAEYLQLTKLNRVQVFLARVTFRIRAGRELLFNDVMEI